MKIEDIIELKIFKVRVSNGQFEYYIRYSADNWFVTMGQSEEPVYNCKSLEELFQRFIVDNPGGER